MNKYIYTVYDNKASIYSNPFIQLSDVLAMRDFSRAVNDPATELYHSPGDFSLVSVGSFDDETGMLSGTISPIVIATAVSVKNFDKE